ncbi:MAG: hypothetical protein N2690_07485 [Rhodocyclaceae bacterium]|nr:hypothetical protein [Rhodocyclaceae bacterium]
MKTENFFVFTEEDIVAAIQAIGEKNWTNGDPFVLSDEASLLVEALALLRFHGEREMAATPQSKLAQIISKLKGPGDVDPLPC